MKSKYTRNTKIGIKQLKLPINERKLEHSPFGEICFTLIIDFFIEYIKVEYDEILELLKWTRILEPDKINL